MGVASKCVASWGFNNNLLDAIGANNGTATGTFFEDTIKKVDSHSLKFDTTDDKVLVGADASIVNLAQGSWGIGVYVPSSLANNTEYVLIGYGGDAANQFQRVSVITSADSSTFTLTFRHRAGGVHNYIISTATFATDTFHLIRVDSTGTAYKTNVNNNDEAFSVSLGADNGDWSDAISPGTNPNVVLGASLVGGGYSKFCGSYLDAMFILNAVPSAADETELWNDGAWIEIIKSVGSLVNGGLVNAGLIGGRL